MIFEITDLKETAIGWLPSMNRTGYAIYWLVISLFLTCFSLLFFIHVDISVRANGIIRPLSERTDIKSSVSGSIDTIYFHEGEQVDKGSILLKLRDPALAEKQHFNEEEISQYSDFVHDLNLLISSSGILSKRLPLLNSELYKQEALRFFSRLDEHQIIVSKVQYETMLNEKLAKDKVISPKEFYDIRMQQQKAISAYETFKREQITDWQADLVKNKTALKQCFSRKEELNQSYESECIRAPVSGYLRELNGHYRGNSIQAGETICSISPGGILIGECYVFSKDIGLLKTGQTVRFHLDAFNYNYFGSVTGNIYSIDNDVILLDKTPVFKVSCRLTDTKLKLSNGYSGEIKKGMSFQARFITCNRSLWQLLFDGLDDWLNPANSPGLKTS